jgi:hypothetical protein
MLKHGYEVDSTALVGGDIIAQPNIILSAHTFENIHDSYGQLLILVKLVADGILFVFEVHSLDRMLDQKLTH